jgi:hypothetical protein
MAVNPNISPGTPPFQTPMTNGSFLSSAWFGFFNQVSRIIGQAPSISDTAAKMVPVGGGAAVTDYTPDSWARFVYYQTDTKDTYLSMLVANVWTWVRIAGGSRVVVVANLASLPGGLGAGDAGLLAFEKQFYHSYVWTGAAWQFAPGDPGSRYIVATASAAPLGGLWQLCDGTTVTVSQGDGTTANVTTPNLMTSGLSSGPVLIGGGGTLGYAASTVPTWQAGARTDTEAAHTHPVTATLTTAAIGAGSAVTTGNTGAGTAHSHNLSDANAKLKAPSDATDATHGGGMPDRFYLQWYMRR